MPWGVVSLMSLRQEFVRLSEKKTMSFTELYQRYGISRKTSYKWLDRYRQQGSEGLADHSHRPKKSPDQLAEAKEQALISLRSTYPSWGARKIRRLLKNQGEKTLRSEEHTSELQSRRDLVCRLLLEK